ncbi:MAG TPA: rod shape-determining protein MreC [Gemmatimonadaceae bacterium]|nr:rod shape-determining protein MreC [Gemmatimonadaceae bacterium]
MARAVRSGTRVDTVLLVACCAMALLATVLPVNLREAIAGGLRRTVVAPLVSLQQQAERGRSAFLSREATTSRLDSVSLRNMQLTKLEGENERLRALLGLGRQLEWGFVSAEALRWRGIGEDNSITLTVGSRAGVESKTPVIAPEGLVGMVTTVDPTSSIAILWTHTDFAASAMSADRSAYGIVYPHLSEAGRGEDTPPERYLLELRGVAFRSALKPGTAIVTSGLGGVYPAGIPIGTVLGELRTSEGWARTYLIRPAVRPPDVSNVIVLLPKKTHDQSLDRVWRSTISADSAARRIAAAGDSLARRAAADSVRAVEAAAVRRAADSVARVGPRGDSTSRPNATRPAAPDTTRRAPARPDSTPQAPRRPDAVGAKP